MGGAPVGKGRGGKEEEGERAHRMGRGQGSGELADTGGLKMASVFRAA